MIINELANLRVLTIAFGFGAERPDHLRMAANATFADIKITPEDFERRIGFNAGNRRHVFLDEKHWDNFDQPAYDNRDRRQNRKSNGNAFEPTVAQFGRFLGRELKRWRLSLLVANKPAGF